MAALRSRVPGPRWNAENPIGNSANSSVAGCWKMGSHHFGLGHRLKGGGGVHNDVGFHRFDGQQGGALGQLGAADRGFGTTGGQGSGEPEGEGNPLHVAEGSLDALPSCGMDWMLLMSALFPAGFMVGLVVAMRIWPPKSVNRMYGYRTRRSMASQEAWDYAQEGRLS